MFEHVRRVRRVLGEFDITVRRGQSAGSCVINRRTGLPMQSRVEQSLEMHVRLADGGEFDQYKSTLTTINTVPEQIGQAAETKNTSGR